MNRSAGKEMSFSFRSKYLLCLCAVMAGLNLYTLWQSRHLVTRGYSDFAHFYAAGELIRTGRQAKLFDANIQISVQQQVSARVRNQGTPVIYMHPPFEALLFVPFSYLPYIDAYLLWNLISIFALITVPLLLRSKLSALRGIPIWSWIILLIAFFPVFAMLLQAQDDALVLLLFSLAYLALRRNFGILAGCCLGLALFRPQFVLPLMFVLALGGEWSALAGFALMGFCLALLTAVFFGPAQLWDYPRHVWSSEQMVAPSLVGHMPNLHGLLANTISRRLDSSVVLAAILLPSAVLLVIAVHKWRSCRTSSPDLAFALATITAILVSYHAFAQDLTLLILPILLEVNWVLTRQAVPIEASFGLLPVLTLFLNPLDYLMVQHRCFDLFALALLGWFVSCVWYFPSSTNGHMETENALPMSQ